jgi:hypothetical protein
VKVPLEGLVMFVVIGIVLGRDAVIIAGAAVLCLVAAAALVDVIAAVRCWLGRRRVSR